MSDSEPLPLPPEQQQTPTEASQGFLKRLGKTLGSKEYVIYASAGVGWTSLYKAGESLSQGRRGEAIYNGLVFVIGNSIAWTGIAYGREERENLRAENKQLKQSQIPPKPDEQKS